MPARASQSLAFWTGLALGLGTGFLASLVLHLSSPGTKRPSVELRAFEAIGQLVEDGRRDDLAAVYDQFREGADTRSVAPSPRAAAIVALLEECDPHERRAFLLWLEGIPWEIVEES